MKRKLFHSMYVKFAMYFLGLFILCITCSAMVVYITQFENVKQSVQYMMESQAKNIRNLVNEQGMSPEQASTYFVTSGLDVTINKEMTIPLTPQEKRRLQQGETVLVVNILSKERMLVLFEMDNRYIMIRPDMENSPISQFITFQKTMVFIPIFMGTILILFAVRKVLKPIKAVSAAAKEVTHGNFDVQVAVKGNDEVADLSRDFNLMVQELQGNEYLHRDFVSNVSHEFKTPITSLKGYAKLLKKGNISEEQQQEYIDIIITESERLSNLSSNLLKLSQLENQHFSHRQDVFSLSDQLRDSILLLQNQWEEKALELDINLEEVHITGDEELLYQVWVNLLSNSIKFSRYGGTLTICLTKAEQIIVEIRDTGIGMAQEEQEKIFQRFYKADKSRNTTGTGLGLPIAKKIIELHGGTITVQSERCKGSRFVVRI